MNDRHCEELATWQSLPTKNRLLRFARNDGKYGHNVRAEHFLPGCQFEDPKILIFAAQNLIDEQDLRCSVIFSFSSWI
ncbi:MAG: hypothetical protein ACK5IQ_03775 [Bacteroidales bacterium]